MFNGVAIEYDDSVISSNGFWGDIEVSEFQKQRAIPVQVPIEMIKASLIQAMQEVELELEEVADRYQAKGILHVREITAVQIGGENFAQTQYKKSGIRPCQSGFITRVPHAIRKGNPRGAGAGTSTKKPVGRILFRNSSSEREKTGESMATLMLYQQLTEFLKKATARKLSEEPLFLD
ncbi:head completion/stabilization protein [Avibacterium paragallinarum]|nr:head completion/stabilization protein [Avibacterium paragallinarum]